MKEKTVRILLDLLKKITARSFILSVVGFFYFNGHKAEGKISDWPFVVLMAICILGVKGLELMGKIRTGEK